jgi:hypothetical protein
MIPSLGEKDEWNWGEDWFGQEQKDSQPTTVS